ncbi:MAG TPA: NAD-dependent epimerase/dehydratase family protein [Trueperaceae bacterium]|nr:NAD-dependent epimerase/dehydratase family protein [Trueperaceae bacterium]
MNVLVTGAHGFLGSHVTERLLATGDAVTALVSPWGELDNLQAVLAHPRLTVVRADITKHGSLNGVCEGIEAVVHAAARVADWGPWEAFFKANVLGTQRLLEQASRSGTRRFLLVSSVAVHKYRGFREADPRTLPRDNEENPYAYSKILAENMLLGQDQVEPVVVRPGLWPFGARDATFQRVERAIQRGVLPLMKRGESVLNSCYAENFADGVRLALHVPRAAGKVYVIADDGMPNWRQLFEELAALVGSSPPRLSVPRRPVRAIATGVEATWQALFPSLEPPMTVYRAGLMAHDVHFTTDHAREELGYRPLVPWELGMRRSVAALAGA